MDYRKSEFGYVDIIDQCDTRGDSLGIIEVLLKIEEIFGLKLRPTDLERNDMATVNNLVKFLNAKIS